VKKKQVKKILDIGEVAEASGVQTSALRYYEEKGLIRSMGRHGLRRLFDAGVLQQLEFIALGQKAGFSLKEIAKMFSSNGLLHIDRKLLLAKASEVDSHIKQLVAVRDGLQHVAHCSAPNHLECPKFQKLLRIAGKTQSRK
jgi:DNA-binding transcriptional MerR regulator